MSLKVIIFASMLLAHSWYPSECCSERDCYPINCSEVKKIDGGYNYKGIFFANSQVKQTPDEHVGCHACSSFGERQYGYCLFLPRAGV